MFLVALTEFQSVREKLGNQKDRDPTTEEALKMPCDIIAHQDLLVVTDAAQLIGFHI